MTTIRPATPDDIPQILEFIRELALYEREPDAVLASEADLLRDGWGSPKRFDCLIAEHAAIDDAHTQHAAAPAGFALFFHNYSTWRGRAGIHLEDLFVRPEFRGRGIGKALLTAVARIAHDEGCQRLQWDVLTWNTLAIAFYESLGARTQTEWRTMRVPPEALPILASVMKEGVDTVGNGSEHHRST